MASRLRAGEAMVDCSEDAVPESTARDIRMASGPMTGEARAAKTFCWLSGLFRPMPVPPTPATIMVATITAMYSPRTATAVVVPALPAVPLPPLVSSLTVRQTSQPQ